tara:strand:+ start:1275 stop:1631 length:357 start_codon:yes stop_codon:yes gene_type:complete
MKNELITLANHLDRKGMHKEADYVDALIKRAGAFETITDSITAVAPATSAALEWTGDKLGATSKLSLDLTRELGRLGMDWSAGWVQLIADHHETLNNIYQEQGVNAAAKKLIELHQNM